MTFLAPSRLWLLVAIAGLAIAYVILQSRRRHYAARFTNLDLLASVAPRRPGWRRHLAAATVALGLVALVVGLARPARDEKVPSDEAVVMLVVDVSASMEATDVAPSRMEAAQAAAARFVEGVPDKFQVGLIAFDESTHVLATPTTDHAAVISAIDNLQTGPGTAGGDALSAALDTVHATLEEASADTSDEGDPPAATIVLVSDGVTTVGQPIEQATAGSRASRHPGHDDRVRHRLRSGDGAGRDRQRAVGSGGDECRRGCDGWFVLHRRVVEPAAECVRRHPGARRLPPRAA